MTDCVSLLPIEHTQVYHGYPDCDRGRSIRVLLRVYKRYSVDRAAFDYIRMVYLTSPAT